MLIEASPVLLTIVVLILRRGRTLEAGAAGLVAAVLVALLWTPPAGTSPWPALLIASGRGAWLAWHAVSVMMAGLLFYEIVRVDLPAAETPARFDHRRLWAACFLLGPFLETATGFGVGLILLVPVLRRLNIDGTAAVLFGLYSQILVPWGALAIGTMLGANLARLDPMALGTASAVLTGPILLVYLAGFWLYARHFGRAPAAAPMLDDFAWTAALWLLLVGASALLAPEIASLVASGAMLPLRWWRDARPRRDDWRRLGRVALPYAALTATMLVERGVPAISTPLSHFLVLRPAGALAPFAPFHHAAFWLALVAVLYGLATRLSPLAWRRVLAAWRRGIVRPVVVTVLFLVMAEIMAETGVSRDLAAASAAGLGAGALIGSPLLSTTAGFLAGTNVAGNALLMPLLSALATRLDVSILWVAALQNVAGASFILFSPIRVAMGCALVGDAALAGQRSQEVYRLLAPLALALIVLFGAIGAIILWNGGS
jgi:lactate permease